MHVLTCVLQLRVLNFLLSHPHKCWSGVNFENVELHNFTSYYTVLKFSAHLQPWELLSQNREAL